MSQATIRKLLEQRLNSVSGALTAQTAFENVPFRAADGTAWQAATLLPAAPENPTLGDDFHREVGVLQVMLFFPKNKGPAEATAQAQLLMAGFKRGTTMSEGSLRVLIDTTPQVGPGRNVNDWYQMPVSIPYLADVFSA